MRYSEAKPLSSMAIGMVVAVCLFAFAAEAVNPAVSTITPRGATRGATVDLTFHGSNLADAVDLVFHDPGLRLVEMGAAEDGKVTCKVEIAPDCSLGTKAIRVRTRTGLSGLRLFSVGGLTEIEETEPNDDPAVVATIPLNTTVNGIVTNEDVDYFAIELAANERLAVEVEALRLGEALFDPKLRLFGPGGHELVAEDDSAIAQQDAAFVFTALEAGRHVIAVSEAAYGGAGNYRYRLHVGTFPRPLAVTPMGGVPGTDVQVTWLGDPALTTQTVSVPADARGTITVSPATDAGLAPTAVPFRAFPHPGVLEVEPNNQLDQATPGVVPGAFDGVIDEAGDVDWYSFEGKKDQVFDVRVWARELGSPLDSVVAMTKPSGGDFASNDDQAGPDSFMRVTLPEDGAYTVRVWDHLSNGGPTFAYRIEIAPVLPELALGVLNNEPASVVVPQGNRAFIDVTARRTNFDGLVHVEYANVPEGISVENIQIPQGIGSWPVVLNAAAEAPLTGMLMNVAGRWEREGDPVLGSFMQDVKLVLGNNRVVFWDRDVKELAIAVSEPAPYSIELVPPQVPLVRSGTMDLKVVATRAEGFTAPIDVLVPWNSPGVGAGTAQIPEGGTEAHVHINANGNAGLGTWPIALVGNSAGYSVSTQLVQLEVSEPWVTFDVPKVETEQGKPVEMVVTVAQAHPYDGAAKAELLGLPKGVTADPVDVAADATEVRFPLTVAADAAPGKHQNLFVRAVITANEEPILHNGGSGQLTVYEPLPPTLEETAPAPAPEEAAAQPEEPERKTRFPKG